MTARRSEDSSAGSLDLLLDTICNTFGGILFLAILVVILLQTTQTEREGTAVESAPNQEQLTVLQLELTSALTELDALRVANDIQTQQANALRTGDERQEREELARLTAERNALASQRLETLQQMADRQTEINTIQTALASLDFELVAASQGVSKLESGLKSELKSRSRNATLPQAKATSKQETALVVRYGRVYFVYRPNRFGTDRELNARDMIVVGEDGEFARVIPKPYAGIKIEDTDEFSGKLREALQSYNSEHYYLALGVWEDSFREFAHLKAALVELGFQYRLIPIQKGGAIVNNIVSNPLVQ
jgi:hypothetical protein